MPNQSISTKRSHSSSLGSLPASAVKRERKRKESPVEMIQPPQKKRKLNTESANNMGASEPTKHESISNGSDEVQKSGDRKRSTRFDKKKQSITGTSSNPQGGAKAKKGKKYIEMTVEDGNKFNEEAMYLLATGTYYEKKDFRFQQPKEPLKLIIYYLFFYSHQSNCFVMGKSLGGAAKMFFNRKIDIRKHYKVRGCRVEVFEGQKSLVFSNRSTILEETNSDRAPDFSALYKRRVFSEPFSDFGLLLRTPPERFRQIQFAATFLRFGTFGDKPMIMVQDAQKNAIAITYSNPDYLVRTNPSSVPRIGDTVFVFSVSGRILTQKPSLKAVLTAVGPFIIDNNSQKELASEQESLNIDYTNIDWENLYTVIPVMTPKDAVDIITRKKLDASANWTYRKMLNIQVQDVSSVFKIVDNRGRIVMETWNGKGVVDPVSGNTRPLADTDKVSYCFKGNLVTKGGGGLKVNGWDRICKHIFQDKSARAQFMSGDTRDILQDIGESGWNVIVSKWETKKGIGFTLEKLYEADEE